MSDTTPIIPAASAPPSYTETESHRLTTTIKEEVKPLTAVAPRDAPPPYEYPPQCPPSSGSGYQRFDDRGRRCEMVAVIELGSESVYLQCPSCGNFVYSNLEYRTGALTCLASTLCFLFCMVCTCLPCFIRDCLDVDHYCPRCNFHFGTFRRL
ncbi:lipopolysaccharide-induced tumor necrosis factor-alpha factor-like protein [Elysia marginata]|uniref:Lipopolysaccharide-induced tumor necrosis factor-alpha factor-like protein n=1 Tax=Elysia marginata TaxID=1093978 RepID=A0AAV4GKX2_9GAST|nr:lipopolysaccharide-induced tumor necrosis factor-alpha factor-like protein [Elysia marginata]